MKKIINKKLKIAMVSKLWEETSSKSKGGTGAAVGNLVDGLVERGHHITLFATENSKTKAQKLVSVIKKPYSEKNQYSEIKEYLNIARAFKMAEKFDIIHCHSEHKSVLFADLVKTPSLHTISYGEFFKDEINLLKEYRHLNFVTLSRAMGKMFSFIKFKDVIYNGLDLKKFLFSPNHQNYFLFLGRISPQKGPDIAIKIEKKFNHKLILAGKVDPVDKKFFEQKIVRYIDGQKIIYKGLVGFKEKIKLIKNAKALILPTKVSDACNTVILEAMACGAPVITFDRGSNKELVEDGVTGFVVKNEKEMTEAIKNIDQIKRRDCYTRAEKFFSSEKMVDEYEKIYQQLILKK